MASVPGPPDAAGEIVPEDPATAPEARGITLELVRDHPELSTFIVAADNVMEGLGYTEHGFRHANLDGADRLSGARPTGVRGACGRTRGCVAAYLHDVGNMISREMHGQTGAVLVYEALRDEAAPQDLATIVAAIANHEEAEGARISAVSAAVILADKSRRAPKPCSQVRQIRSSTSTTA